MCQVDDCRRHYRLDTSYLMQYCNFKEGHKKVVQMSSNVKKETKHHRGRTTADVLHLQTEHKKTVLSSEGV